MPAQNAFVPTLDESAPADDLYLPAVRPNTDRRTKLQRSYAANGGRMNSRDDQKVNACPWCKDHELDENDYCQHLIGTTLSGDFTVFYPVKKRDPNKKGFGESFVFTDGTDPRAVLPGDVLREIRDKTYARVYRESGQIDPPVTGKKKKESDDE